MSNSMNMHGVKHVQVEAFFPTNNNAISIGFYTQERLDKYDGRASYPDFSLTFFDLDDDKAKHLAEAFEKADLVSKIYRLTKEEQSA